MSKSIISNEYECLLCGDIRGLHKHHIFQGVNRQLSEKYGCWVYLCPYHHNMSNYGVHSDKKLDVQLKRIGQKMWEKNYGTREDFIQIFGRNYLDESGD